MNKTLREQLQIPQATMEDYFPTVLVNSTEIQQTAKSINPELDLIWKLLNQWTLGNFIYDTDSLTIEKFENMFFKTTFENEELDSRRERILQKFQTELPYTHRKLDFLLSLKFPGTFSKLDYNSFQCQIEVPYKHQFDIAKIIQFVQPIIPTNLVIHTLQKTQIDSSIYLTGFVDEVELITIDTLSENYAYSASQEVRIFAHLDSIDVISL